LLQKLKESSKAQISYYKREMEQLETEVRQREEVFIKDAKMGETVLEKEKQKWWKVNCTLVDQMANLEL